MIVEGVRSIVVVGANGSGKTRLGTFVEQAAQAGSHRISAQRSLNVPVSVQPRAHEQAEASLLYGSYQPGWDQGQRVANKRSQRWGNEPEIFMLNDYESLLAFLFADEAKRNREYSRAALLQLPTGQPSKCKVEALSDIWNVVMPQRSLLVTDDRVQAKGVGSSYEARHMSDGERVTIYLIGQALCAPPASVVIIDEPELHLHRAVQAILWNQIEAARPDCTFVYITHDLDFAVTRTGGRRIWLKEYDGNAWVWDDLETVDVLPDALAMEVLGSRRPILFVEGDETSHDAAIYAALFPGDLVVCRQSCEKVIEATKAMKSLPVFHHLAVRGLVDRDRRGEADVDALKAAGLLVANVAEVENLLCIPEALVAVATQLKLPDPHEILRKAQTAVLSELAKQVDQQALSRALAEIQFRMNGFGPKIANSNATALEVELNNYVKGIDAVATVAAARALFNDIVTRQDYGAALRYFNCKGILAFVSRVLGVHTVLYAGMVLGILKEDSNGVLAQAMRKLIAP